MPSDVKFHFLLVDDLSYSTINTIPWFPLILYQEHEYLERQ